MFLLCLAVIGVSFLVCEVKIKDMNKRIKRSNEKLEGKLQNLHNDLQFMEKKQNLIFKHFERQIEGLEYKGTNKIIVGKNDPFFYQKVSFTED